MVAPGAAAARGGRPRGRRRGNGRSASALLELRNVGKRFGGLHAVKDVSLGVQAGEIVGLIGPNGAGKTTLFSVIAGNRRTAGAIASTAADRRPPAFAICRAGIARTFQVVKPFAR